MRLVRRVMARTRRQSRWVRRFLFVISRELKNEQRKPADEVDGRREKNCDGPASYPKSKTSDEKTGGHDEDADKADQPEAGD